MVASTKKGKSTSMVPYNPKRRKTIYKIRHHTTKNDIYIGQTYNRTKRRAGYARAVVNEIDKNNERNLVLNPKNLMIRYVKECEDLGIPLDLELLDEFPDGVPADRADGFEALMINDKKTSSEHPEGRNTSMGNCLGEHKEKFPAYRKELEDNHGVFKWPPADIAMRDAIPQEVVESGAKLAALQHVQDTMRDAGETKTPMLDDQVKGAITVYEDTMRQYMGPLQHAETLAEKYMAMTTVPVVEKPELNVDINGLRDCLKKTIGSSIKMLEEKEKPSVDKDAAVAFPDETAQMPDADKPMPDVSSDADTVPESVEELKKLPGKDLKGMALKLGIDVSSSWDRDALVEAIRVRNKNPVGCAKAIVDVAVKKSDLDDDKLDKNHVLHPVFGLCNEMSRMARRDLPGKCVGKLFSAIADAIQAIEEGQLLECDEVTMIKQVRETLSKTGEDWIRSGKQATEAELTIGNMLRNWKKRKYLKTPEACADNVKNMRFLLRSRPESLRHFDEWLLLNRQGNKVAMIKTANRMLRDGFEHFSQPKYEGQKVFPAGANGSEVRQIYNWVKDFALRLSGRADRSRPRKVDIDMLLEGVEDAHPETYAWWMGLLQLREKRDESGEEEGEEE